MKHRKLIQAVGAVTALFLAFSAATQAPYPVKPIRFIVGFPPGGTNDIVARALGQKLTEQTNQQFIIDNRGGANTAIASEMFVRMPPDGYSIMLNAPGHATNPALMKLNFDSIRDFSFITIAAESQNLVVVHPSFPPRSVKDGACKLTCPSVSANTSSGSLRLASTGTSLRAISGSSRSKAVPTSLTNAASVFGLLPWSSRTAIDADIR
jgi:tripartite-type tricarboxylate transporter receptor subunit TctC